LLEIPPLARSHSQPLHFPLPPPHRNIDQSSLKNMCRRIKTVWSQILSSFSKGLSIYQLSY
jgi:hypothetical protein